MTSVQQVFVLRQFFVTAFYPARGGGPGQGGNGSAPPPVQKEPEDGYSKKEAKRAAPGRRKNASSGEQGTQKAKKAKVAPKGK